MRMPISAGRVLVAGAGPAGLTLASELALAGIPCRVLDRRCVGQPSAGVVGLHARALELFDLRGQAHRFADARRVFRVLLTCGSTVDLVNPLSRFPCMSLIPQCRVEAMLVGRARELGVEVIHRAEVVGLDQDENGVRVHVVGPDREWTEHACYLVGCDGAESTIRRLLNIPFEGSSYEFGAVQADVRLGRPPVGDLAVHLGQAAVMTSLPGSDGWHHVTCVDATQPWVSRTPTLDELSAMLHRAVGQDLCPQTARWLGRYRIHKRLVRRYREGRVLLAGDAAHLVSPVGVDGINLAIEDAVNLGWKLAATLSGGPDWLLDSYERERRTAARTALRAADRATLTLAELGAPDAEPPPAEYRGQWMAQALRDGGDAARPARSSGGSAVGRLPPGLELIQADGQRVHLRDLLVEGRFLLLDLAPEAMPARVVNAWAQRVNLAVADPADPAALDGLTTAIVRPDGYLAWSTRVASRTVRAKLCREALAYWCGPPE